MLADAALSPVSGRPLTVKNKGIWMNGSVSAICVGCAFCGRSSFSSCFVIIHVQDLPLTFEWLKVDHTFPTSFPINTINMMRALRAIQEIAPEKLEKATDAFYVRYARFSSYRETDS